MNPFETLLLLVWAVSAMITASAIGGRKGRRGLGVLLGLLLGWIGVLIIALMQPTRAALVQRERERLAIQREARG